MSRLISENKVHDASTSHISSETKSVKDNTSAQQDLSNEVAGNVANRLLSLAAVAEDHAKAHANANLGTEKGEDSNKTEVNIRDLDACADVSKPTPERNDQQQRRQPRRIAHPWTMRHLPPPMRGVSVPLHGFYAPSVMHPVYSVGPSPGGSPSVGVRYTQATPWTTTPRFPFHPQPHSRGPSPMPFAYRGKSVPTPPPFIAQRTFSPEEDSNVNGQKRPAPKRVSLGPTKSILKKARGGDPPGADAGSVTPDQSENEAIHEDYKHTMENLVSNSEINPRKNLTVEGDAPSAADINSKKQPIISPASSNECQRLTQEDEMSSFQKKQRDSPTQLHQTPYGIRHVHRSGFYAGVRPYPMSNHTHMWLPPTGMYPMGNPTMYHPSMSSRGHPGFPPVRPSFAHARMVATPPPPSSMSPEQHELHTVTPELSTDTITEQLDLSRTKTANNSKVQISGGDFTLDAGARRCVPLNPPVTSKHWSDDDITKDIQLPDFHRLVNFPDHLVKTSRTASVEYSCIESGACDTDSHSGDGKKRCVMCGHLRVSATLVHAKGSKESDAAKEDDHANDTSSHIIPRQNKGVCTACDITVWIAVEFDGLEIKWCKGCKNFRPWAAFGSKGSATKCVRCRDRQKEKYALQKATGGGRVRKGEPTVVAPESPCSLALVAANGLQNLMKAT